MTPLEFFHTPAVVRALERTARSAAVPVSLHYMARAEEGTKTLGFGQCAACRHVAGLAGGAAACRASRREGSQVAQERGRPASFVCHMGFGCVAVPALADAAGFVLTLGPYCPAEEPRALEAAALRGLEDLEAAPGDSFPVSLADIRIVPVAAIPAIAEWTVEVLDSLWRAAHAPTDEVPESDGDVESARPLRRRASPALDAYHASDIAAALMGGDQPRARALIRAALAP